MRCSNLPDGGHGKVTWKRSRGELTRPHLNVTLRCDGGVPQQGTSGTSWIGTTETSW